MKLLNCTIENYGKLKKQSFTFNSALTSFCQENGYGKTTLASFIEAMFYGLESARSGGKFYERTHYYPFEGGAYGGNLTFEMNGKIYKIERFFDEKSEKRDSLTVYENGSVYTGFGTEIGKSVFGIDKASFERTLFIAAGDVELSSTGSINAKLNAFVEGGDDNLGEAVALLEKTSKIYKKDRQGNDLITEQKNKISDLNEAIVNATNVQTALLAKYNNYEAHKAEMIELEQRISEVQKSNVVVNNWEHYDALTEVCRNDVAKIKAIEEKYPFGIPTDTETQTVISSLAEEEKLKAVLAKKSFTERDEAELTRLQAVFVNGIPADTTLIEKEQEIQKITDVNASIALAEKDKRTEGEEKLCRNFLHGVPTDTELVKAQKNMDSWRSAQKELADIPPTIAQTTTQTDSVGKNNSVKKYAILAICCALILCVGIVLLFVLMAAGIALSAIGGTGLLVVGFLYLNGKSSHSQPATVTVSVDNPVYKKLQKEVENLSNSIKAFLIPYGYCSENGLMYDFLKLNEDIKIYLALQQKEKEKACQLTELKSEKKELEKNLANFFRSYGYTSEGYLNNLAKIRTEIKSFLDLRERKESAVADTKKIEQKIKNCLLPVADYCVRYNFDYALIAHIIKGVEADGKRLQELKKQAEENAKKAQNFKEEKGLDKRPIEGTIDLDELNKQLHTLQSTQSVMLREIEADESVVEHLDELQAELSQAEEQLSIYKKKYELLTITTRLLKEADTNLKNRYIQPVKDRFLHYAEPLERALGEKVTMSKDFEVRFEQNGKERSEKHLSSGQRSLCALCFRLALIDNMYIKEKPFLILDDPFIHLDKTHMERIKTVLCELAQGMQLLYFTCHESRNL
jgi:uncharacterized protein YhaN